MKKQLSENEAILQLIPTASLVLSLTDNLFELENRLEGCTYKPTPGVYLINTLEPIIEAGKPYYTSKGLINQTPIIGNELAEINDDVFDENGNVVISKHIMLNKNAILKNHPSVNTALFKIARLLIEDYINSKCPIFNVNNNNKITRYLVPEAMHLYESGEINNYMYVIYDIIDRFIGKDVYHIYFVRTVGLDLIIDKVVDYRIYQWTKQHFGNNEE